MILESVCVGPMEVNCYVLASKESSSAVIVDPGAETRKIKALLDKHKLKAGVVINTHGHYDHIGSDDKFAAPVYIHSGDLEFLKDPQLNLSGLFAIPYSVKTKIETVEDGRIIEAGDLQLKVIHIPGHTPGGIALQLLRPQEKILFTGDSLFCDSIGRSDLAGGNEALLIKCIKEKLLTLPDDTVIYPGHGPSSTIGREKKNNPFLR